MAVLYMVSDPHYLDAEIPALGTLQITMEEPVAQTQVSTTPTRPLCWTNEEQRQRVESLADALRAWGQMISGEGCLPKPCYEKTIIWVASGTLGRYQLIDKPTTAPWHNNKARLERARVYMTITEDIDEISRSIGLRRFLSTLNPDGVRPIGCKRAQEITFGFYNLRHDMLDKIFNNLRCNEEDYGIAKVRTRMLSQLQSKCVHILQAAVKYAGINCELDQEDERARTFEANYSVWCHLPLLSPTEHPGSLQVQLEGIAQNSLFELLHTQRFSQDQVRELLRQVGNPIASQAFDHYLANQQILLDEGRLTRNEFTRSEYIQMDWFGDGQIAPLRDALEAGPLETAVRERIARLLHPAPTGDTHPPAMNPGWTPAPSASTEVPVH